MCDSVTTIKRLSDIKDTDIYIKHESVSYKFEITKKAFLNLNKRNDTGIKHIDMISINEVIMKSEFLLSCIIPTLLNQSFSPQTIIAKANANTIK